MLYRPSSRRPFFPTHDRGTSVRPQVRAGVVHEDAGEARGSLHPAERTPPCVSVCSECSRDGGAFSVGRAMDRGHDGLCPIAASGRDTVSNSKLVPERGTALNRPLQHHTATSFRGTGLRWTIEGTPTRDLKHALRRISPRSNRLGTICPRRVGANRLPRSPTLSASTSLSAKEKGLR